MFLYNTKIHKFQMTHMIKNRSSFYSFSNPKIFFRQYLTEIKNNKEIWKSNKYFSRHRIIEKVPRFIFSFSNSSTLRNLKE